MKISLSACLILFTLSSKAAHIVGGDITVKYLSPNTFEVTLTFYRDCSPSSVPYDFSINLGVYDKVTDAEQQTFSMNLGPVTQLILGDTCYTPPNLCVEKATYQTTISLPDNTNGYYIIWHRCCRNVGISNINVPGSSGYVFYTEIPDPALQNSSPVFDSYPDAYMCVKYPNKDNFSATDVDGDSLIYDLTVPLDCGPTTGCVGVTPPSSGPYGTIQWQAPYSLTSIMGDSAMAVNPQTGIVTTTPPNQGKFVFCVRVSEYRAGVKIGEIRSDIQYAVLPCVIPTVFVGGPNPICLGQSSTLTAVGGQNYIWNTGATTISIVVAPTAVGTYTFSETTTVNPQCHITATAYIIVNSCAGINEQFLESGITLFPNPAGAGENSNIQFNKSLNEAKIKVLSEIGQVIYEIQEKQINSGATKTLEVDQLTPGIYLVLVISDGNLWSKKLIKK